MKKVPLKAERTMQEVASEGKKTNERPKNIDLYFKKDVLKTLIISFVLIGTICLVFFYLDRNNLTDKAAEFLANIF